VSDQETRDQLSRLNAKYDPKKRPDPFYGAPVVLAVLSKKEIATGVNDGSLMIGNMMLAAHSLGIGSCWIHRAKEEFESEEGKAILKDLGIEGDYEGIGHLILGYPAEPTKEPAPRKGNYIYRI
jgi:nitroreductase